MPERGTTWIAHSAARQRSAMLRGTARIRVAHLDGDLEAAAVFRITDVDSRWQLDLLIEPGAADDRAIDAVLRCAVRDAGKAGARRLFARMPSHLEDERALRRAGFVPYAIEHVLQFNGQAGELTHELAKARRIHPADVWGIHQLYLEVVPRQVQYAEAVTSRAWDDLLPLRPGAKRASGWVMEEHGRIRAFARISNLEDRRIARLDLLVAPDVRGRALDVVVAAVKEAQSLQGVRCVAIVPGYEVELVQMLEDMGFADKATQTAFVCYTTVSSRAHMIAVDVRKDVALPAEPVPVPGLGSAGAVVATHIRRLGDSSQRRVDRSNRDG